MSPARWLAFVLPAVAAVGCEPARPAPSRTHAVAPRTPTFASQRSKPIYEQAVAAMRAMDALRGSPVTEAVATDLGFKCADLKELGKQLEAEPDPIIWRLRSDIDRTCNFDVPLASALVEIALIQKKQASDPGADIDGECRGLKIAIADLGTAYIGNPQSSDVIAKDLTYCGSADSTRRVP